MKTSLKTLWAAVVVLTAGLSAHAASATAFSELGFKIHVSAGTVQLDPAFSLIDVNASGKTGAPGSFATAADSFAGSAPSGLGFLSVNANANNAQALTLESPDELYVTSTSLVDFPAGGRGMAYAFASLFTRLVVVGTTDLVTLTFEPLFATTLVDLSGAAGRIVDAYADIGISVGSYGNFYQSTLPGSDDLVAALNSWAVEVQGGESIEFAAYAGSRAISAPDAASTLVMATLSLLALAALQRRRAA